MSTQIMQSPGTRFWTGLVRQDATYTRFERQLAPTSRLGALGYLALYMLPGVILAIAINVPSVFFAVRDGLGVSGKYLQFNYVMALTFGWHIAAPFLILRYLEKLSWRETLAYIGLDRIDWRSLAIYMPATFVLFTLVSIPYMRFVYPAIQAWTETIPWMRIPAWSIFQAGPDNLYSFGPVLLLLLFIGNFVGEEVYFRGYLYKKTAFLGSWNWVVNSALFTLYHLWQVPQTWPLIGICFVFGAFMQLRKDLWSIIILHLLINLVWPPITMSILAAL